MRVKLGGAIFKMNFLQKIPSVDFTAGCPEPSLSVIGEGAMGTSFRYSPTSKGEKTVREEIQGMAVWTHDVLCESVTVYP